VTEAGLVVADHADLVAYLERHADTTFRVTTGVATPISG
jgi:hypothetical protein